MNKLILPALSLTVLAGVGMYLVNGASLPKAYAYGEGFSNRQGASSGQGFQQKADLFNMSTEELAALRDSGKTMLEIAQERGISEDTLHAKVQEAAIARWTSKGLTDAEIQSRLASMKESQANCDGVPNNGSNFGNGGRGRNVQ